MRPLWYGVQAFYTPERKLIKAGLGKTEMRYRTDAPREDEEITSGDAIIVTKWFTTKPAMRAALAELRNEL